MTKNGLLIQKNDFFKVFVSGFIFLFVPVLLIVWQVLHYTHGVFMYTYDDTFIHLKIAQNFIHKGNWGINGNDFASASSSPLYTLLLAAASFFSDSVMVPFAVNCVAGIAIIIALQVWLQKELSNFFGQSIIISLAILITPLPLLIVSGMEHTLQCLFSFLFIFYFSDWLASAKNIRGKKLPLKIFVFAACAATIRYEGLFLIAIACVLLLAYKKIFQAFLLGCIASLPVIIFGLISLGKGSYFLPNSVLVKSGTFSYSNPLQVLYEIVFDKLVVARNGIASLATQRLLIAIPLVCLVFKKYLKPSYFFILVFLFFATVIQLSFAATGYVYRYEAYLFFCFTIIFTLILFQYSTYIFETLASVVSKISVAVLAFFLLFPVLIRSASALTKGAQASINIYDQQYQMALFTKKYYNHSTIAINDIGALSFYTEANILDLWGLANIEITKSKKNHYWTPQLLDSLSRQKRVDYAMIYDVWFSDSLTKRWNKVATWQIQNNVVSGDNTVSFYTLDASKKNVLEENLKSFEAQLPKSVVVQYY